MKMIFTSSKLLYWLLSKGMYVVNYFKFSSYNNLSYVVVTGNLCVLARSKILNFKRFVACSLSFLGSITNADRTRESGGNRALFVP